MIETDPSINDMRLTIKFIDNTEKIYKNVTDIDIVQRRIDRGYLRVSPGYLKVYQGTERVIIPIYMIKDIKLGDRK